MKKKSFISAILFCFAFILPSITNAKPVYFPFKLGIKAKWSIVINRDCDDGKGLCLVVGNTTAPTTYPNYIGYDDELDKINIRISKQWPESRNFTNGTYIVEEDSQIDPRLVSQLTNFKYKDKNVFIKKGTYKVIDDGEFYLLTLEYYIV